METSINIISISECNWCQRCSSGGLLWVAAQPTEEETAGKNWRVNSQDIPGMLSASLCHSSPLTFVIIFMCSQETAARDGLMKMKTVYEANPALGDPMSIQVRRLGIYVCFYSHHKYFSPHTFATLLLLIAASIPRASWRRMATDWTSWDLTSDGTRAGWRRLTVWQ